MKIGRFELEGDFVRYKHFFSNQTHSKYNSSCDFFYVKQSKFEKKIKLFESYTQKYVKKTAKIWLPEKRYISENDWHFLFIIWYDKIETGN